MSVASAFQLLHLPLLRSFVQEFPPPSMPVSMMGSPSSSSSSSSPSSSTLSSSLCHGSENQVDSTELARSPLFQRVHHETSYKEMCELSYKRAQAFGRLYALTMHDVLNLTPKFWEMHSDYICALDGAVLTLITIQYNLTAGTLAPFAAKRPELRPLMKRILDFDINGQYLMTEIAHGLDAANMETTATLLPNGDFDLHTPHEGAAKIMPPSAPICGLERVGIVMAQLVVNREKRGIRPFLVPLGDEKENCPGVTVRLLPRRGGLDPVDHAITSFTHVRLPPTALLGSLSKPADPRANFLSCIWRVDVGSLAISVAASPMTSLATFIAARYSLRRHVTSPQGTQIPIWSFRTQQLPVMHALAQSYCMREFVREMVGVYTDRGVDRRTRGGVAAMLKAVMIQNTRGTLIGLSDRCGAQGLFPHNQIVNMELIMRGVAIAEGDVLALAIRLASELLLGRYSMPASRHPHCLLARHESALFAECLAKLAQIGDHRSPSFNRLLLPMCLPLIQAIGQRMVYEAALDASSSTSSNSTVPPYLLALYEIGAIKATPSWFAESAGIGRWKLAEMEDRVMTEALKYFEDDVARLGADAYAQAPILTDEKWRAFVQDLQYFAPGNAEVELYPSVEKGSLSITAEAHL